MEKLVKKENEDRKTYLVRVAIVMLQRHGYEIDAVEYDEAECDAFCLAEDLSIEFDLYEND